MNMDYSYPTTMYESILAQMCVSLVLFTFFAFYHEIFLSQNCKKKIFLPEICIFGRKYSNTLLSEKCSSCSCKYCFFKIHLACHSDVNGLKPGSNQK